MAQRRPRNAEQLKDYLWQEWGNNSTSTLSRLISCMLKCLAAVIRRKGDIASWYNKVERTFLTFAVQVDVFASFIITICIAAK